MPRLAVVTCALLASAVAKPPPARPESDLPEPIAFVPAKPPQDGPDPIPFDIAIKPPQDGPDPIPFQKRGERASYTLPSGKYHFKSPNYPENYPNDNDLDLTAVGNNNQDITVTCSPFALEAHSSCAYDYLSINGAKYCGTNAPPTMTVKELRVRFYSDKDVTASGFYCLVTVAERAPPPSSDCNCGLRQTRVVGGTDAAAGQFPWQAGLVSTDGTRSWCGGSVINNRYVLTAAHCTEGKSASQIQVMLGDLNIGSADSGEQRYSVQQIINHPSYTSYSDGWDFSLLKLDRDIVYSSTIQPVCLPTAGQTYAAIMAIASGYGQTGATLPQATTLQHVQVPVWSQSRCSDKWGINRIKSSMICAGGYAEGGRSVCMGDSGGPLVTEVSGRFRLIGVVSFGRACAVSGWADVYARVTEALSWIASSTADVTTCTP